MQEETPKREQPKPATGEGGCPSSLTQHQQLHGVFVLALQVVGGRDNTVIESAVSPHEFSNLKIGICYHKEKDPVSKLPLKGMLSVGVDGRGALRACLQCHVSLPG